MYNCWNKLNNFIFEHLCEKISGISCIKNYSSLFDKSIVSFVNSKLVEEEIERNFNETILHDNDDKFEYARINSSEIKIKDNL